LAPLNACLVIELLLGHEKRGERSNVLKKNSFAVGAKKKKNQASSQNVFPAISAVGEGQGGRGRSVVGDGREGKGLFSTESFAPRGEKRAESPGRGKNPHNHAAKENVTQHCFFRNEPPPYAQRQKKKGRGRTHSAQRRERKGRQ